MNVTTFLSYKFLKAGMASIKSHEGFWVFLKNRRGFSTFALAMLFTGLTTAWSWSTELKWFGLALMSIFFVMNAFFIAAFVGARGASVLLEPEKPPQILPSQPSQEFIKAELAKERPKAFLFSGFTALSTLGIVIGSLALDDFESTKLLSIANAGLSVGCGFLGGLLIFMSLKIHQSEAPAAELKKLVAPVVITLLATSILAAGDFPAAGAGFLAVTLICFGCLCVATGLAQRKNSRIS
jgi:hypothetical protein